jgi:restriction endonuclease S subunit
MAQLAAEQQKLAEMLSNLGEKISEDNRLRQMLEKLAEEMDETANSMRMNEKRELVERKQLDIYRRLLDARRSRKEKDESEERKSWTAKKNISIGADKLADDLGEKERQLNERITKAMHDDFDPEYKKMIRRYFESLLQKKAEVAQ